MVGGDKQGGIFDKAKDKYDLALFLFVMPGLTRYPVPWVFVFAIRGAENQGSATRHRLGGGCDKTRANGSFF
jgi:hypothetical protein